MSLSHIEVVMELWAPPQTWIVLLGVTTPAACSRFKCLSVTELGDSCLLHLLKALLTGVCTCVYRKVPPGQCLSPLGGIRDLGGDWVKVYMIANYQDYPD